MSFAVDDIDVVADATAIVSDSFAVIDDVVVDGDNLTIAYVSGVICDVDDNVSVIPADYSCHFYCSCHLIL